MEKRRIIVLSLGGSIIVPDKIDFKFLDKFREILRSHYNKYKFVVVCGGGSIARKYIEALRKEKASLKEISLAGIRATRMNALFVARIFGEEANDSLPRDMKDVKNSLTKNNIVVCGALRYAVDETSDATAAKLAHLFKTDFINMTNVSGLYSTDPKKNEKAEFIPYKSWDDFEKIALRIKYKAGQHFVLDQHAAKLIKKNRTRTFIIGRDLKQLDNILKGKLFVGTRIEG